MADDSSDTSNILGSMSSLAASLGVPISLVLQLGIKAPELLAQMAGYAGAKPPAPAGSDIGSVLNAFNPISTAQAADRPPTLTPEELHPQGFNIQWGPPSGPTQWPAGPGAPSGGGFDLTIAGPEKGTPPATPPPSVPPSVATLNANTPSAVPGIPGEPQIDQSPNALSAGPGNITPQAATSASQAAATSPPAAASPDTAAAMMSLGKALSGIQMPARPTPLPSGGVIHPTPVGTNDTASLIASLTAARTPPSFRSFL
jgi:hypothetical protein